MIFSNHEFKSNFRKKFKMLKWCFLHDFSLASDLNGFFWKVKPFLFLKFRYCEKTRIFFKLFSGVIKFGLSEKHTKLCAIFPTRKIFSNFVCFPESPNFNKVGDFFKFVCPSQNIWTLIRFLDHIANAISENFHRVFILEPNRSDHRKG